MSHFGVICPPFLGHFNPMQALAGALVARGHRVSVLGIADAATLRRSANVGFVPLGVETHRPGTLARIDAHMADPDGLKLFRLMADMARMTDMLCREAPAAIARHGIDALIVDQMEPAGGLIAAHLGLPILSVANALLIDREPDVPPSFVGWPYDPSAAGRRRNRGGYRVADAMMLSMRRVIARHAAAWGLGARRRIDQCLSPLAGITQTVSGFDFPRQALSPTLHACGPLRATEDDVDVAGLLHPAKPLVFASLGTLQGGRADVFRRIAQACHMLGLHLVIAHGGRLSDRAIADLPGTPVVRSFVPQRALLRHAALAVTNGGLNTVLDALAAGVPLVTIPIAFEQAAIAARLERCGAGLSVPLPRLTDDRLRDAMGSVRSDPSFATAAAAIAAEIRTAGGVAKAARIAEAVVRLGRPITAADLEAGEAHPEPRRAVPA